MPRTHLALIAVLAICLALVLAAYFLGLETGGALPCAHPPRPGPAAIPRKNIRRDYTSPARRPQCRPQR